MNTSDGQRDALYELQSIEGVGDALEILRIVPPKAEGHFLLVTVTLSFKGVAPSPDGIPLRQREQFHILVPANFPFKHPSAWVSHKRWAGRPHVQWQHSLCLYVAPDTEWNPSDGMFGFIDRLYLWVKQAAANQLDPAGAPLHPPVAYISESPTPLVIPYANTPSVSDVPWIGFGCIERRSEDRVDITGWCGMGGVPTTRNVAAVILLPRPASFEFPDKLRELMDILEEQGVSRRSLIYTLGRAAEINGEGNPLLVLIGTPTRGISGSGIYQQHIVAWISDTTLQTGARLTLSQFSSHKPLQELGREAEDLVLRWADSAKVNWCRVRESRPEVTIRRDEDSPLGWFRTKSVAVWGCGAIGSHVAEALARAGVTKLVLKDNSIVTPGILVRQSFEDADIGKNKAIATRERLLRIIPGLTIEVVTSDLLQVPLDDINWADGVDLIIDATASVPIAKRLEARLAMNPAFKPVVASMVLGHQAQRAMLAIVKSEHTGGTTDVSRKTKLEVLRKRWLNHFADEFWPEKQRDSFQPEPGCSDPTFIGSQAEVVASVGMMLSKLATEMQSGGSNSASSHLFALNEADVSEAERREHGFYFEPDISLVESVDNYVVRISRNAFADLQAWVRRSERLNGPDVETGGHLFGERDDATRIIWVSEVTGPPSDSQASPHGFLCGFEGMERISKDKERLSWKSVRYMGMWHTHPKGSPIPSDTDYESMADIVNGESTSSPRSLLLVVGGASQGAALITASLFSRGRVPEYIDLVETTKVTPTSPNSTDRQGRDVGLALSGGGSRAIAFHLGCLRALHDRGILHRVEVISGVSGGAVLTAMYGYSHDQFLQFDERVQQILLQGLQGKMVRRALFSRRPLQSFATTAIAGFAATCLSLVKAFDFLFFGLTGLRRLPLSRKIRELKAPFRRWVSRTHAFEDVLRNSVLGDVRMSDNRRDDVEIVINATELRTGSAFRFGSKESGVWRFGKLPGNDVQVAHAVAASAAYPLLLPGFDETLEFQKNERTFEGRVVLSDGGIYDNLGTSCFEPGRSEGISYNVYRPRYIIACDAGQGLFSENSVPYWWLSRVTRSTQAIFRKAQDRIRSGLFHFEASGQIDGFILPYLGTIDRYLPYPPADLVEREAVFNYPTDFAPMRRDDLDRLALRGEQITRLLITRYLPEL